MKKQAKWIIFLCVLPLTFSFISQCLAQVSDLKIEADPFQYENDVLKEWSNDMKKIGITTEKRGLIFKITISNVQNEPITVEKLEIQVRVRETNEGTSTFFDQVSTYIYLPPNEKTEVIIPVDFGHGEVIGSYIAEIQRIERYDVAQNIEPYPFEFRVLSEDQFQKELEQKKEAPFISIGDINITLFDFSISVTIFSVGLVLVLYYLRKRR